MMPTGTVRGWRGSASGRWMEVQWRLVPNRHRPTVSRAGATGEAERGSATIWVLAAGMVMLLLGVAVSAVGSAIVARHRAQQAADLAALAGAGSALFGETAACARAAELVEANGATMLSCHLDGLDVTVSARVAAVRLPVPGLAATAAARAGPAEPDPPDP